MSSAKIYTVDDLLTSVKRRASIPVSDDVLSDADLLRFGNEVIDENLGALILSTKEEFYLTYVDVQLASGETEIEIPYRAFGSKIRLIKPVESNGKVGVALSHIPLDLAFDTEDDFFRFGRGFYLNNDKIVLVGGGNTVGSTLRIYYYLRPNNMVESSQGGVVRSIDTETNTVTLTRIPQGFRGTLEFDFIQALPNHKTYAWDQEGEVNVAAKTIVFSEDLPEDLEVGDYICLAGETITPQIPVDVNPVLEQSIVCKVLEAIGDTEGLKNSLIALDKLEKRLFNIIDTRVEGPGFKANNTNSLLRSGRRRYRSGGV